VGIGSPSLAGSHALSYFNPVRNSTGSKDEDLPLEKKLYTDPKGKTLPYRLLKPDPCDPRKKYPLVLFLHGAGERGNDNEKQLIHGAPEFAKEENRRKYPCFLTVPQCPEGQRWADWSAKKLAARPTEPLRRVMELLQQVEEEYPIDSGRIYVTGLSMGGFGTFDLIERHPERFAAAVPVCGGGDVSAAAKIAHIPIWLFHGARDKAVPVARSRAMVEALKRAGGQPRYTEYLTVGHESWVPAYKDQKMFAWLFAQKKSGE
jgi:predicted peptidase